MILRMPRRRSGITLTEILISIMILGVGFVSLATLFPLGLLRLRDATRYSRSAVLTESASGDLEARDLLNKSSFLNANMSPWYSAISNPWYAAAAGTPRSYDPWVQDTPGFRQDPWASPFGAYRGQGPPTAAPFSNPIGFLPGPGLPVAYDPLWRQQTGVYLHGSNEARFASGLGFVRPDPHAGTSTDASAHGLQRITNFSPFIPTANVMANAVPDIFVSPEDVVLQSDKDTAAGVGGRSPIVPDLSFSVDPLTQLKTPQYDWNYTWMFTGRQADCTNGTVFTGDIVVFEKRPFALEPVETAFSTNGGSAYFSSSTPVTGVVAGETVVEAVFGYTNRITPVGATVGYGASSNRAVLLRWSDKMPDPELRVGNWIADVTYERVALEDQKRRVTDPLGGGAGAYYPYQRCHWYQIAKRTDAAPGQAFTGDPGGVGYREMTVWVNTPLRALTLLDANGHPYHVNAALVSPYVVNVFPRTIYTR